MLSNIGPKKCCRSVRHIHAANALTAHVSNAQLKLRVTTLLGAPLRFWVPCKSELSAPHPNVLSGVEIGHHLPRESLIIRHSEPKRETRSDLPAVLCQVAFLLSTCSGWSGTEDLGFKRFRVRWAVSTVASRIWRITFSAHGWTVFEEVYLKKILRNTPLHSPQAQLVYLSRSLRCGYS